MADVLIVDDDLQLASISARVLGADGHAVRTASNGTEGLRALGRARLPECVILDVEMPQLSGPEMAYEMFRHDAGFEKIPIVLVSGRPDLDAVAARVGTPYYLEKGTPNYFGTLSRLLDRAIREGNPPSAGSAQ